MKLTHTNLFALSEHFGTETTATVAVRSTSYTHIKRCFTAGLLTIDQAARTMTLTDAGIAALAAYRSSK